MSLDSLGPEPHTDPKLKAFKLHVEDEFSRTVRRSKQVAGLVVLVVAPLGGFAGWVLSEARASGSDAGAKVQAVARQVEENEASHTQVHRLILEDVHETQVDVRALYKSWQTGKRSERLEAPLGDGGAK